MSTITICTEHRSDRPRRDLSQPGARLFLDTSYVQALLNPRDSHHRRALSLLPRVKAASEVVVTEAVLIEVGNALSGP